MKKLFLALPLAASAAFAATTTNITPGEWDLYVAATRLSSWPTQDRCIQEAAALNVTQQYQCRTSTTVMVTVIDGGPTDPDPTPTGTTFTDLSSAPACARVTIYPAKTVVDASGAGIPIHTGRCLEAWPDADPSPSRPKLRATWAGVRAGDVVYLHGGTYEGIYGEGTWTMDAQLDTFKQGTAAQPIALVAYPGESVTFRSTQEHANFVFGDGNGSKARYITVAGLNIIGRNEVVAGGGDTSTDTKPESGGELIRLVGNRFEITNANGNTMTGLVAIQGDGWKVLGNTFVDPANRIVINNNHALYIQNGADDVEAAYNTFRNLHVGFTVQVHQDGAPMLYERINVHHNAFEAADYDDMRGVTTSNIQTASTVTFAHNTFRHLGQGGWGCINVYAGQVTLINNTCEDTQNGLNVNGDSNGNGRRIIMSSNKLCPAAGWSRINYENGATTASVSETNPVPCN